MLLLALQEIVVLMIDQLEERIAQMLLDQLIAERQGLRLEVQEVPQHQVEVVEQLDHIILAKVPTDVVLHQVEVLLEVAIHQVEVLLEVALAEVLHQVEALAEVVLLQAEALLAAEVAALAEVLLEETNKKVDFKLFFQNQLLYLSL